MYPKTMLLPSLLEKSSMPVITLMPLCPARKLIPLIPDTDLSRLIAEGYALATAEPLILEMIDRDRDAYALAKKRARLEDQAWLLTRGQPLQGFDVTEDAEWVSNLEKVNVCRCWVISRKLVGLRAALSLLLLSRKEMLLTQDSSGRSSMNLSSATASSQQC
jgi:hypothetical protein